MKPIRIFIDGVENYLTYAGPAHGGHAYLQEDKHSMHTFPCHLGMYGPGTSFTCGGCHYVIPEDKDED